MAKNRVAKRFFVDLGMKKSKKNNTYIHTTNIYRDNIKKNFTILIMIDKIWQKIFFPLSQYITVEKVWEKMSWFVCKR